MADSDIDLFVSENTQCCRAGVEAGQSRRLFHGVLASVTAQHKGIGNKQTKI